MKHVHIVIPELFLAPAQAKFACEGLELPALEKVLARSNTEVLPEHTLEDWLCHAFAVDAVAPVTLAADGGMPESGYWLRADPVYLNLNHDRMIVQTNTGLDMDASSVLCSYLNQHFSGSGMYFQALHPQRWYLRLDTDPELVTTPLSQVEGRNARDYLPRGKNALKWHTLMNEIQMALYAHPLHAQFQAQGRVAANSLWLWGGGCAQTPAAQFEYVASDGELALAFARAAGIHHGHTLDADRGQSRQLLVFEAAAAALRRGDFHVWREAVLRFEGQVAQVLRELAARRVSRVTLDVIQESKSVRCELTPAMLWKFWKPVRPLRDYALV